MNIKKKIKLGNSEHLYLGPDTQLSIHVGCYIFGEYEADKPQKQAVDLDSDFGSATNWLRVVDCIFFYEAGMEMLTQDRSLVGMLLFSAISQIYLTLAWLKKS